MGSACSGRIRRPIAPRSAAGRCRITGCHSVIDRPESVSRVIPPTTTIARSARSRQIASRRPPPAGLLPRPRRRRRIAPKSSRKTPPHSHDSTAAAGKVRAAGRRGKCGEGCRNAAAAGGGVRCSGSAASTGAAQGQGSGVDRRRRARHRAGRPPRAALGHDQNPVRGRRRRGPRPRPPPSSRWRGTPQPIAPRGGRSRPAGARR